MRVALITLAACLTLFAQHRGGGMGGRGGGFVGGGGRGGGFVGGGGRGGGFVGDGVGRGGGYGGGAFRPVNPGFRGFVGPRFNAGFGFGYNRFYRSSVVYYPFSSTYWPCCGYSYDPYYYGAGYSSGYGYGYGAPYAYGGGPNITIVSAPAAPPAEPIVINYEPRRAETRDYTAPSPAREPEGAAVNRGPALYLIALKNGVIWAAVQYSVQGQTLHFITRRHEQKQVPLSDVDRALTEQVNSERHVDVRLP